MERDPENPAETPSGNRNARPGAASPPGNESPGLPAPLLEGLCNGDPEAAREAVELLNPMVCRILQRHLHRHDDLEDLLQEVFLKMFRHLDQYRGQMPFHHWVSRIAVNTALDRLRRHRSRPTIRWSELSEAEQVVLTETSKDATAAEQADAGAARALFDRLLDQMDPKDAWLLREVELEERSLAEVAATTGWNATLTRVRLFRARARLRKLHRQLEGLKP